MFSQLRVLWKKLSNKVIQPRVVRQSSSLLVYRLNGPETRDYVWSAVVLLIGLLFILFSTMRTENFDITRHWWKIALNASVALYVAFAVLDDTFTVTINQKKNTIKVKKADLIRTKWIKGAPLDELVSVENVRVELRRGVYGYRIEFALVSETGTSYRLPSCDVYYSGDANLHALRKLVAELTEFARNKPNGTDKKKKN
ncbi:uncharacterized protein BJ171DRAFT_599715 [Polychytrium aggregatum]|uniref:uncharacterized protein n=1 Tax=Polychytrium aggregatum TaxID=110093 RepID=UPI0022FE4D62|nr:uncharacterized protein BJ171DRAFT_599715 [Polychytrium aggregatum]KAI9203813.1 hypothetical protein BJ171DRAFT_599715 [Polychytrium aggregatum]